MASQEAGARGINGRSIGNQWNDQRDWPSYSFNNGCFLGLPRTLQALYEREKEAVQAVLAGRPVPSPVQSMLFNA